MTIVVLALWVIAAVAWVAIEAPNSRHPLRTAGLQLTMLAQLSWSELGETVNVTLRILLLIAAGACIARSVAKSSEVKFHWIPAMFGYSGLLFLSGALSANPAIGLLFAARYGAVSLLFAVGLIGYSAYEIRRLGFGFGLVVGAMTATQLVLLREESLRSIRSQFLGYVVEGEFGLGTTAISLAGCVLALGALRHQFRAPTAALMFISGTALVVLTQRRAAVLFLAALILGHILSSWRSQRAVLGAAAGLVLAVAFSGLLLAFFDREAVHPESENVTSYRSAIFEASLERFYERPIIGGGLRVGDAELATSIGRDGTEWISHSELGAALAASGIVGTTLLLWQYYRLGLEALRLRDSDPVPLFVFLATLAVLPFWRVLADMSLVSLVVLLYLLPATPVRRFTMPRRGHKSSEKSASAGGH